ncbi:MAG: hypothetical protein JXA64_05660 [Candidatus Fermentibacteraceae bacterium]|nr:hypothetical protein [Candidatus Fermentibacteraceae bacterium]MBN2608583.1 hypothetical protein [Candidatus Fermentibacteraceae bacterium]
MVRFAFTAKATVLIPVIALAAALIPGCGDDPSSPGGSWDNGDWTGQTASGLTVTFTLDHPTVTDWTLTVTHDYADTTDIRTWTGPQLTVGSDSTFSWSDSVYSDSLQYSFSMDGIFTSGSEVSGEWDSVVYYQIGGGSGMDDLGGSWSAEGP